MRFPEFIKGAVANPFTSTGGIIMCLPFIADGCNFIGTFKTSGNTTQDFFLLVGGLALIAAKDFKVDKTTS